ncbi:MAG: TVP38/TMEM64 family protein [Acidobacteriota bacterium]
MSTSTATADTGGGERSRGGLVKGIALLVAAVLLFLLVRRFGPAVQPHVSEFLSWIDSLGVWAPVAFIVGYVVLTVALIPGSLLTMSGGVLFGLVGGTLYVAIGATLGASAAFLISRYLARGRIEKRLEGNRKFAAIDRAVGDQGLKIVLLLRLSPFFPFVWLNYGLGLTQVRFRDFLLACLGMLPGTFLYVYYGKAIGSLAALAAGETAERGAEQWVFLAVGLVATVLVTTVVTRIAGRALAEATDPSGVDENDEGRGEAVDG